jgi:RNA polymerase sigma-B factor
VTTRPDDPMAALLAEYARTRDAQLRDEVVLASMDLVEHLAQRYRFAGEPVEDLVQEGTIGLINAVEMFDPSRGVKFSTYASHAVQGAIQHYLRDKGKLIREPGWLHDLNQRINRARTKLGHTLGREASAAEIAADIDLPESQVHEVLRTRGVFRVSSLEQPTVEDPDATFSPAERDKARGDGEPDDVPLVDRLAIEGALDELRTVERAVVYDFFFNDLSKSDIARKMGYSSSHVAHLLRRALKQLKDRLLTDERSLVRRQLRSLEGQLEHYARRVAEESTKDDLTGLFNRRYLLERLDEEVARSQRYKTQLSVVLAEVLGLDAFRQAQGEAEADQVLCTMARLVTAASRRIDRLGRYDDARFILLLPNTGQQATVLCRRLAAMAAEERLGARTAAEPMLVVASGIAVYPDSGQDAETLVKAAFAALAAAPANPDGVALHWSVTGE